MTVSLARVDSIFPTPLYRYRVDQTGLNEALATEIAARRKAEQGMANRNRLGWQSNHDFFQRKEAGHARLARTFAEVAKQTIQLLDPQADFAKFNVLLNGWVNVNPPGGYNSPHQHSDAHLSGVYYVEVPKSKSDGGGAIEFLSPHPVRLLSTLIRSPLFSDRVRVQPAAGDLLVFPSQLMHWVLPNDSGKPRVTAAFNATIQPKR
jgi:uncharacterized protein (TIGR02466 family)